MQPKQGLRHVVFTALHESERRDSHLVHSSICTEKKKTLLQEWNGKHGSIIFLGALMVMSHMSTLFNVEACSTLIISIPWSDMAPGHRDLSRQSLAHPSRKLANTSFPISQSLVENISGLRPLMNLLKWLRSFNAFWICNSTSFAMVSAAFCWGSWTYIGSASVRCFTNL